MKNRFMNPNGLTPETSGAGWQAVLMALFLGLFLGLPGTAQMSGTDTRDDDVGNSDDGMEDDETVGTLPLIVDPRPGLDELFDYNVNGFLFSLTGPTKAIRDVIVDAFGDGYVELRQLDEEHVRLLFHGNVTVVFDERLTLHPEILTEVRFGQEAFGAPARFTSSTWRSRRFGLPHTGRLNLQMARLRDSGMLDEGPVQVQTAFAQGQRHGIKIEGHIGLLSLTQN